MVNRARARVAEVHVGDARRPAVAPQSVDVLLLRFLNADVVTTRDARQLLQVLVDTVRSGGRVFAYGHTPLRLTRLDFEMADLTVERCVAASHGGFFQMYEMRKGR